MTLAVAEIETPKKLFQDYPLFSVIVPVYKVPEGVFKRCLMSLADQDYSKLEVILVFDGPDPLLLKVAEPFLSKLDNWKVIETEHKGACAARNAGFYASSGEIVSFTNSDYNLKRGIVRLWVDKLLENKEYGFAYGGYEYSTRGAYPYASHEFDPYLLEVANYIDCGFPLWRKYFVPWDENCKSLQDWDFWIRVVKEHKVKGYYLGSERSFVAEPPRLNGLSHDSSSNWIERVKYIKEKNQIPLRDIVVTSPGARSHGVQIAKMLDADYRDDTIFKPNEYKACYMIGFYMKPNEPGNQHGPILSSFSKDTKRIVHWIGADIYWLRKFSYENLKALGGALKMTATHLVESDLAQKELKDLLNIDSYVVPIPPYSNFMSKPLPEKFSVAIFLTEKTDFDKYLKEHTLSIVRACPDIQFNSYGDGGEEVSYHNLKVQGNLPREKWKEFVYGNSCLIRLVRHDTTPLANNEFMMAGRAVISNVPGECTHYIDTKGTEEINNWDTFQPGISNARWADTKKQIVKAIRMIKKNGSPQIDFQSLNKRFDKETYINKIYELCSIQRRFK